MTCLFLIENCAYFILKIKREYLQIIFSAIISIIGYMFIHYSKQNLPLYIDLMAVCIPFFMMGIFLKKLTGYLKQNYPLSFLIAGIIHISSWVLNFKISGDIIDIYGNSFGNIILFYLEGIAGAIATITIIMLLSEHLKLSVISFIGKNSIIYYALHQSIFLPICNFILKRIVGIELLNTVTGACIYFVLESAFVCIVITPFVFVIKKHFPFVLGKSSIADRP